MATGPNNIVTVGGDVSTVRLDTDAALTDNSDYAVPTQKAIKAYVTAALTGVDTTEMDLLDGATAGTVVASKAVAVDANKDVSAFRTVGVVNLDAGSSGVAGSVDVFPATAASGKATIACADQDADTAVTMTFLGMGQATAINVPDPGAATGYVMLSANNSDLKLVTATADEINTMCDATANAALLACGAGFAGAGTIYKTSVVPAGGVYETTILIDLTGAASSTTDLDIIGTSGVSHIGQIVAANHGTILGGTVTCLETPAGGADDIDIYAADEGTGAFDAGVEALTETALLTRGAPWAAGDIKPLTAVPGANQYLYLTGGEGGTAGTYTAGQFLIKLYGY